MVTNVDDIYAAKESDGITGITENVKGNLVAEKINYGAIYYEKFDDIVEEPLGLCEDEEYVIYYVTE